MAADPVALAAESLARRTGMRLPSGSRTRVLDALTRRARLLAGGDLHAYAEQLGRDPEELDSLFDIVAVGQTAFLRHPALFDAVGAVLPDAARRSRGDLHLVSAGCSTGEEAWTLAACAMSSLRSAPFMVTALDWSRDAIATARAGRYPAAATEAMAGHMRRWFEASDVGASVVEAGPSLRERVRFVRANLTRLGGLEAADLVLFCNVGIYFERVVMEAVVARLHAILRPGGLLFLGAAESLWGLEHDFELVELGDVFGYRRSWGVDTVVSTQAPRPVRSTAEVGAVEPSLALGPDPGAPEARAVGSVVQVREALAAARAALASGVLDVAAAAAHAVLAFDEFDVEAHFVLASVADRSGASGVVEAYRRVLYLDPDFALARACSAPLLERDGQRRRAAVEYRAAAQGLVAAPSRYEPYLEAMSPDLLADACLRRAATLEPSEAAPA